MNFFDECYKLFGTKDLYQIFDLKKNAKNAEIKKAYYKQSILCHPDRFSSSESEYLKNLATQKFQIVNKIYNVLSNSDKRQIYDTTNSIDDDFGNVNWKEVWRKMFKKVTTEDIENYLKEFRGSDQEMEDVKKAYIKYKGDLDKIFETVIGADVENENRIREIINYYIERKEVEAYTKFTHEPPEKRLKRLKKAKKEAEETKKSQINNVDLVVAIQNRKNQFQHIVSNLEEKYGKKTSTKLKLSSENKTNTKTLNTRKRKLKV